MSWRILARHKWVPGCTISESINSELNHRRYTATIRGWQNWKLYEGPMLDDMSKHVIDKTMAIRTRIDKGDESVFDDKL